MWIMLDGQRSDLDSYDREALLELRLRLENRKDNLEESVAKAKYKAAAYGQFADPDAFSKWQREAKSIGRNIQAVQGTLGLKKRAALHSLEVCFMDAARVILDKETFTQCLVLAQARNTASAG